jgi:hypothetical protein
MVKKIVMLCAAGVLLLLPAVYFASGADKPRLVNDDAGWCWFQDERAIFSGNKLIAGSVAAGPRDGARKGNVEVSSMDMDSGRVERFVLHDNLELDDHNAPALLSLPDGRILAVYTRHGKDRTIRYRTTMRAGDISEWTPERIFEFDASSHTVTYSNLFRLEAEGGRIYDFHRGRNYNPNVLISDDNGESWRYGGKLVGGPGRPYVRYASDGKDTVHFVCTEQHPRDFDNSIYHGYVRGGKVYDSFGKEVGALDGRPAEHSGLTRIFRGNANNVAWPSDFESADDGRLFVVYSVQKNGAGLPQGMGGMDHRYRYAWFDGEKWRDHEVARAGSRIYSGEDDYTGLICLHPQKLNTVYFSTNADPVSGRPLISGKDGKRHYEIFKGVTENGGETWRFTHVTSDSTEDQIRPNVPRGGSPGSALMWLRGRMKTYSDYDLQMVMMRPAP